MRTSASASGVCEQVLPAEGDASRDAGGAGIVVQFADPGRIDVDAEAARAVAAGGGDQDAAVARAEVDDIIVGPDLGEAEHRVDHLEVGRDIGDVEPRPALDELGRVEVVAGLRRRRLSPQPKRSSIAASAAQQRTNVTASCSPKSSSIPLSLSGRECHQKVKDEGRRDVPDDSQDEAGAMTPLHPDQVKVLAIRTGLLAALLALAALAADLGPVRRTPLAAFLLPLAVLALGVLATLVLPRRRYRRWGYREGEDELEIRRGMLVRVRTIVPFGRVQHIDVAQGPVQRRFGLATLILHTAGTQSAAVPLPGLLHGEAEAMRDRIRAKIRQEFV